MRRFRASASWLQPLCRDRRARCAVCAADATGSAGMGLRHPPAAPPGAVMPTPPAESKDATMHQGARFGQEFHAGANQQSVRPRRLVSRRSSADARHRGEGPHGSGKTANEAARACGLCHYPNGKGRSENSSVSGLPVSYFIQQMNEFRNDTRKSSEPRKANAIVMVNIAKAMTEQEIKEAAGILRCDQVDDSLYPGRRGEHRSEDACHRRRAPHHRGTRGGDRADRPAHHRGPGTQRALRAPRSARRLGRLRAGRQHQEGRGTGQDGRKRQDRGCAATATAPTCWASARCPHCRSFSQHAGAPDVGHETGHPSGQCGPT